MQVTATCDESNAVATFGVSVSDMIDMDWALKVLDYKPKDREYVAMGLAKTPFMAPEVPPFMLINHTRRVHD